VLIADHHKLCYKRRKTQSPVTCNLRFRTSYRMSTMDHTSYVAIAKGREFVYDSQLYTAITD